MLKLLSKVKGTLVGIVFLAGLGLTGCAESPSTLDPRGFGADQIAVLWWVIFGLATVVFVAVVGVLLYALFRSRSGEHEEKLAESTFDKRFVIGGAILTVIILVIAYLFTLQTMSVLASVDPSDEYVVEVIGHQWWWEVKYPNQQVITANEIHIPVGQPVQLQVMSADVIHSFWVPELHGKIDMIPGQVNTFWLEADEAGVYYGLCAEFCGTQHAKMLLVVVAEPADAFTTWLSDQAEPAQAVTDAPLVSGKEVFTQGGCANCHTIRGTEATGNLGPDLTHLASRRTLAAGILENNRGNLGGWIVNPQQLKPGNKMPPTSLSGTELQDLLAYLQSLQ